MGQGGSFCPILLFFKEMFFSLVVTPEQGWVSSLTFFKYLDLLVNLLDLLPKKEVIKLDNLSYFICLQNT